MYKGKPDKKTDVELWRLISKKVEENDYLFLTHAKQRLKDRCIIDTEVLDILENKGNSKRKRNKKKDKYDPGFQDWKYCIEGFDLDEEKIRVIISFDENLMLVITVIRLDNSE